MSKLPATSPICPMGANDPAIREAVMYWAGAGVGPCTVLESIGMPMKGRTPDWFDVCLALSAKSKGFYGIPREAA